MVSPTTISSKRGRCLRAILITLFLAAVSLGALISLLQTLPPLSKEEISTLRWPIQALDDARHWTAMMTRYKQDHFHVVLICVAMIYVFMQTFAIPGSVLLSLIMGPLLESSVLATLFISIISTTGALLCYVLVDVIARDFVEQCFHSWLIKLRQKIHAHRHNLFFYALFLRVSPLLPNWFITVASPIVGIPIPIFVASTFLGLMPANFIHARTGIAIHALQQPQNPFESLLLLLGVAVLVLLPTFFRKRIEQWDTKTVSLSNDRIKSE